MAVELEIERMRACALSELAAQKELLGDCGSRVSSNLRGREVPTLKREFVELCAQFAEFSAYPVSGVEI